MNYLTTDEEEQAVQATGDIRTKVNTNRPTMATGQRLEIADRLGLLECPKGPGSARDRKIRIVISGQLNEEAAVVAPLVHLASRVKKAGTVAGGSCDVVALTNCLAHLLEQLLVFRSLLNIAQNRDIIALPEPAQMGGNDFADRSSPRATPVSGEAKISSP
jgi:hypothetical protein